MRNTEVNCSTHSLFAIQQGVGSFIWGSVHRPCQRGAPISGTKLQPQQMQHLASFSMSRIESDPTHFQQEQHPSARVKNDFKGLDFPHQKDEQLIASKTPRRQSSSYIQCIYIYIIIYSFSTLSTRASHTPPRMVPEVAPVLAKPT